MTLALKILSVCVLLFFPIVLAVGAQNEVLHLTPAAFPASLEELCDKSDLIVEAHVQGTYPSYESTPRHLATDALLRIDRVLKGRGEISQVVVSQEGGVLGTRKQSSSQYGMMAPGDHYILFLKTPSSRPTPLPSRGAERYDIMGNFLGAFAWDKEGKLSPSTSLPAGFKKYEANTSLEMLTDVDAYLRAAKLK